MKNDKILERLKHTNRDILKLKARNKNDVRLVKT